MTDVIDVLYRFRDMTWEAADRLRTQIREAQVVLDRLDAFARDSEEVAELSAASDLFPSSSALIPERSGLIRRIAEPSRNLHAAFSIREDMRWQEVCTCPIGHDHDARLNPGDYDELVARRTADTP